MSPGMICSHTLGLPLGKSSTVFGYNMAETSHDTDTGIKRKQFKCSFFRESIFACASKDNLVGEYPLNSLCTFSLSLQLKLSAIQFSRPGMYSALKLTVETIWMLLIILLSTRAFSFYMVFVPAQQLACLLSPQIWARGCKARQKSPMNITVWAMAIIATTMPTNSSTLTQVSPCLYFLYLFNNVNLTSGCILSHEI